MSIYSTNIFSVGLSVRLQKEKELRYLWMLSSLFFDKNLIKYGARISALFNALLGEVLEDPRRAMIGVRIWPRRISRASRKWVEIRNIQFSSKILKDGF